MSSRYLNAEQIKKECYKFRPVPAHRPDLYILEQPPVSNLLRPLKEQISIARTHDVSSMLNILEQSGINNAKEMYAIALKNPIPSNPIPIPSNLNRDPFGIEVSPIQSRPIDYLDLAFLRDPLSPSASSSAPSLLTESDFSVSNIIGLTDKRGVQLSRTRAENMTAEQREQFWFDFQNRTKLGREEMKKQQEFEKDQELKARFNELEVEMGDRPSPLDLRRVKGGEARTPRKSDRLRAKEAQEPYIEFRPDLQEIDY